MEWHSGTESRQSSSCTLALKVGEARSRALVLKADKSWGRTLVLKAQNGALVQNAGEAQSHSLVLKEARLRVALSRRKQPRLIREALMC